MCEIRRREGRIQFRRKGDGNHITLILRVLQENINVLERWNLPSCLQYRRKGPPTYPSLEMKQAEAATEQSCARNVEVFLKKTAIACHQNLGVLLEYGWYAIEVFFKNASTLRVRPGIKSVCRTLVWLIESTCV